MKNKKSLMIFIICYLAYTSIYVTRINLSMASPGLVETGVLDSAQIGIMGSLFSVIYAFGRFINGGVGDRQQPWVMISVGLALAGVSNILAGLFPPFVAMTLLWMTNAFAQSMLWSSVLKVVSAIYDEKKAKKMASYMVTSVATGNIAAIIATTYIIEKIGLNFAFVIPGCFTLIMSTCVVIAIRKIKTEQEQKAHISFASLLAEGDIRRLLVPAALHGVMKDNVSLWMTVYFVDKFAIDLASSALFVLFIPVIGLAGRLMYPIFYKLCKEQEHKVSVVGFVICVVSSVVMLFGNITPVVAAFALSFIYAATSIINTTMLTIYPMHYIKTNNVSSVSGIMDFATYFGAGVGSFAYGFVIKTSGYMPMFVSWAVISVVSIILVYPFAKKSKL